MRLPQIIAADMLAVSSFNGPLLDLYRDPDTNTASTRRLFATDHPSNVLVSGVGTIDNIMTTTLAEIQDGSFFEALGTRWSTFKGANGKSLGLSVSSGKLLIPNAREQFFKRALEQEVLLSVVQEGGQNVAAAAGLRNRWLNYPFVIAHELTSDDYFYAFPSGGNGLFPWVVQSNGIPDETILDKSSALYERERKVGVDYIGEMEVAAALPHGIIRIQFTG
jgi:hypothetical protein